MKKTFEQHASAVIVAAGRGTRMKMDINKQYMEIAGKPVLARTIQAFEDCVRIDEIVLVVNVQDIIYCKQAIIDTYGFRKVKAIVAGGAERQNSVFNGLRETSRECGIVAVHDGARPFVREQSITDSIDAACEYGAACVAVPVKDTIKSSDGNGFVGETLERNLLWSIQTPQAFKHSVIMDAYNKAFAEGYTGTDDAVLVERLGIHTRLVMGSYDNIKITTAEDIVIAEAIATGIGT